MVISTNSAAKAKPRVRKSKKKRILVLSGGGYRGLFCAEFLKRLENPRILGPSIADVFDMIVCTSTGSIIGAGLIADKKCDEIVSKYRDLGSTVFPGREEWYRKLVGLLFRQLKRALWHPPYSTKKLGQAITHVLGPDAEKSIFDFPKVAVFTSVEYFQKKPFCFSTDRDLSDATDATLLDAILSSTAAPTYFNPVRVGENTLIDGGIFANSPEIVALQAAKKKWNCKLEDIVLLSIGTAAPSPKTRPGRFKKAALAWVSPGRNGILSLLMSTQEETAKSLAATLLGEKYYRADGNPSPDEAKVLKRMDYCSEQMERVLSSLAETEASRFIESDFRKANF